VLNRFKVVCFFFASLLLLTPSMSPAASSDGKTNWFKKLASQAPARSEDATPTIGVRGLDEAKTGDAESRDYPAIDRLEKIQPTSAELDTFKKQGQLP
jgi:hypothetical protein